jgi:hypothetical protein
MKKLALFVLSSLVFCLSSVAQSSNAELPAITAKNADSFFIPKAICTKFELEPAKGDAWMKVYNNLKEDAKLQRVNDIRWQATSLQNALDWYKANNKLLSENGKDITDQLAKPIGVDAWNVYEANIEMKNMMEAMGIKQNQYTFTFVVDKYVAKVFVGVNDATSAKESWNFVKEALIAVLKASGKTKLAALVL